MYLINYNYYYYDGIVKTVACWQGGPGAMAPPPVKIF